ncbi:aspartate dehydrogenase [Novosphingobium sp. YJ-S2-02]|uniref:L-aspartate dehydrogenase n=1 Tax=Novosphingobium aureum TaxID=2792964 RepID=A0A931MLI0_9SPHN|nr:aspartate dehydrogenase [Novosphingobium aureum]MBH0114067.1 aspartate dehydrogenase [Novosphingobium aureum]
MAHGSDLQLGKVTPVARCVFGAGAGRIGLIGHGAIGTEISGALERLGERDSLVATLVREGRDAPRAVHDVEALIAAKPDCVIECAGHAAAHAYAEALLRAGIDVVLSSVGVLADDAFAARLLAAEAQGGGRAMLPAGAIAGLDGFVAAALAGIDTVTYTSFKPPHAWRGTPAQDLIDLDHREEEVCFFEGSAREAAANYPKNANVAVAVGLSGIGLEQTRVRLVSSRKVADPLGVIEAEGPFGRFAFDILALAAPSNPKTSALTAYSLLQCARLGNAWPIARLVAST